MARSTHHRHYQTLLAQLRELREAVGMTQIALGEALGNTQTFVSKFERGERRIDTVEFVEICEALGASPVDVLAEYVARRDEDRATGKKVRRSPRKD